MMAEVQILLGIVSIRRTKCMGMTEQYYIVM
jgi:hypothetical protein